MAVNPLANLLTSPQADARSLEDAWERPATAGSAGYAPRRAASHPVFSAPCAPAPPAPCCSGVGPKKRPSAESSLEFPAQAVRHRPPACGPRSQVFPQAGLAVFSSFPLSGRGCSGQPQRSAPDCGPRLPRHLLCPGGLHSSPKEW